MSDLRDQIHGRPVTADEQVFLDYHHNSPWAKAKVEAGVHVFPEAVAYMKQELAERARAEAAHEKALAEIKEQDNAERAAETPEAEPDSGGEPGAAGVGGFPGSGNQAG